jgi:GT2 family glycosyltransferase
MKQQKIEYRRPLAPSGFASAAVDILIPYHGQYEKVIRAVESVLRLTRTNDINLCLIDDYSSAGHFQETLAKYPKVTTFRTEKHSGFGPALNLGFKNTNRPWVVILHSDCEIVEPNWLLEMGTSLLSLKRQGVRMISSRMDNPGNYDPRLKMDKGDDVVLETGCLPLICTLAHRELFSRIGGFVRPYPMALYEDEELGHRMKYYNFKQAICGNSFVKHEGGATIREVISRRPSTKAIMESNYDLMLADVAKVAY